MNLSSALSPTPTRNNRDRRALSAVTAPKFGKTESGNIWLDRDKTSPYAFYQYWLNVSDEDASNFIKIFTLFSEAEIMSFQSAHDEAPHQRFLQKKIAEDIINFLYIYFEA